MRKAFGISVAASLALLLAGCADDSSCESNCVGEADAAVEKDDEDPDTDKDSDTDEDSDTETNDDSEAGTPTETDTDSDTDEPTEAGTSTETQPTDTSDASSPDVEPEAGTPDPLEEAGTAPGDAAVTPGEPTEAGSGDDPDPATDGGGGGAETACDRACATASEKGCAVNETCETDLCNIRDVNPNCTAEVDAYFDCIGRSNPNDDFVCNEEDEPQFVGTDCEDPYFNTWFDCIMAPENQ